MSRLIMFFLLLLTMVGAVTFASQPTYVAGKFIIKFREGTPQYQNWIQSGRTAQIEELRAYVGNHSTRGYLSEATLQCYNKKVSEQNPSGIDIDYAASLRRIVQVEASSALNLALLVRKISSMEFLEYAELQPAMYTFLTPNDTLYNQQYHLRNTKANVAWDSLQTNDNLLIGIVDTGVDYEHPDLKANIFTNPGEMGTDASGKDKSSNQVDDDKNGFVDDWHGWDFAGSAGDGKNQDNNPRQGPSHGTHVAGIAAAIVNNRIGVAGMCNHARILAIKTAADSPFETGLVGGYEGVLYAASMGAKVINCSWGGGGASLADKEIIETANGLDALIVVAAGNNGQEGLLFPAAYPKTLSVAAVGSNDAKASFSNYSLDVSICAPGVYVWSTLPSSSYGPQDGTSMACPVVAGGAAMARLRYPNYNAEKISALLQGTADNVDAKNGNRGQSWAGKIGTGRLNVLRAVTASNVRIVKITTVSQHDKDGDDIFDLGNTVELKPDLNNLLSPLTNCRVVFSLTTAGTGITLSNAAQMVGAMASGETKQPPQPCSFTIPSSLGYDVRVNFLVTVYDDTLVVGRTTFDVYLRPSYRTLRDNNITLTVNSKGNFAYNDYSSNLQGEGLRYKGSKSVLFEGGLMVARSATAVSDVVRNDLGSSQNKSFNPVATIKLKSPGTLANTEGETEFADAGQSVDARVGVKQRVLQSSEPGQENFVISIYDITNNTDADVAAMYAGIYCDWDIGPSGRANLATWDESKKYFYVYNTEMDTLPWAGMQLLSAQTLNAYMMDNDTSASYKLGVYDGYTDAEKFTTMSSGIGRTKSTIGDVSTVIAAGPFAMKARSTERVVFSIFVGKNLSELDNAAVAARKVEIPGVQTGLLPDEENNQKRITIVPNPSTGLNLKVLVRADEATMLRCEVVDLLGNRVAELVNSQQKLAGAHIFVAEQSAFSLDSFKPAAGTYLVRLTTTGGTYTEPYIVLP